MTGPYDAKPWLARYGDVPAEVPPSVATALDLVHRAVRAAPEQRAITYFDGGLRYREVDDYSDAIAAYLAGRGFGRGDRPALYLQNVPQFVLTLVAAWKLGGVVVPVNPMYRERELNLVLRDAGVSALVCSEAAWDTVAAAVAHAAGVRVVLTTCELDLQTRTDARVLGGIERRRAAGVDDVVEVARSGASAPPPVELHSDDLALICYTSGTSGVPKGATTTHANLTTNADVMIAWTGLAPGSAIFALAPLFHIPGGRLLTGDIGFMDADGWFYVVDRKKDMINAAGFKVWPREVEDVLYTHPAIREAGVVGVPDAYRGETVKAYVSLQPGRTASERELVDYCRGRMAAYKCPRQIEILPELPKTISGKILRRELRDAVAASSTAQPG